jgi:hypothetical protein
MARIASATYIRSHQVRGDVLIRTKGGNRMWPFAHFAIESVRPHLPCRIQLKESGMKRARDKCTDDREVGSVNVDRVINSIDLGYVASRYGACTPI